MPFISEVATIFIQRLYTGWITLRNQTTTPIRVMGRRVIELYDALIAGNDWEITPWLSLKRRAGHTAYVTITYAAMKLYSWKSNTQGTIPIVDTLQDVEYVSSGSTVQINTKAVNSGQNLQSSILGIGDYLYVGNPQQSFKWDGPNGIQGVTNWGITNNATAYGPTIAGTGANSGGGVAWTNPTNVTSAVSFATVSLSSSQTAQILTATSFGFSVPTGSNITGIVVTMNAQNSGRQLQVNLMKAGVAVGTLKTVAISGSPIALTLGTASDLWGATWAATDVNNTNFGISIRSGFPSVATNNEINNVNITIYVNAGVTGTPTGSGSFSAVNGFTYVVAYGNSISGEISNASVPGPNTGPFSSKSYVGVPVTASTDPQVNQIRVFRTTDSGGGNQFFEISNSPFANTSTTIQDTTPDTSLQVTSQAEINLGNTPPPAGIVNLEWFAGRMWGSVNNLLYASTGPETLSGTAPNSNWNPEFQWVIPGPIVRNVNSPNGMIVFTNDDSYIVRGTDITNYTVNEFVKDFGIRTYNAVDTDGTNLYVFTSDRQFIMLGPSGAEDIGLPIADQLLNVDSTSCYVSVNRYGLDSIVRILDTVNNVYYDFNLNQQCWQLPGILQMAACTAMGSIETSPGVWRLLLSSTNSGVTQLAYRDLSSFLDLGTAYAPNAVFGSIQLADPGNLAKFGGRGGMCLEYTNAGTAPTLSVLFNDIGATLTNAVGSQITGTFTGFNAGYPISGIPTLAEPTVNYRTLYYYMAGLKKRLSGLVRHMQFQISAPAENTATELIGFGIFGDQKSEAEASGQLPQLQGK